MSRPILGPSTGLTVPLNVLVAKKINLCGTYRLREEFAWAVGLLPRRSLDVMPLLTEVVPLTDAVRAFDLAADGSSAMKVQLAL